MTTALPINELSKTIELLDPLDQADRVKVLRAAFSFFAEGSLSAPELCDLDELSGGETLAPEKHNEVSIGAQLPKRAQIWLEENHWPAGVFERLFFWNDEEYLFVGKEIQGKTDKDKTIGIYLISGLLGLFTTGKPSFEDKKAWDLCESYGVLNRSNHRRYLKDLTGLAVGDKKKGWTLTSRGLQKAKDYLDIDTLI